MKVKNLDDTGNRIELSGKISINYIIRPGVTIIFGKGATVDGISVEGQTFYNDEYVLKQLSLSKLGKLYAVDASPLRIDVDPQNISDEQPIKLAGNDNPDHCCCLIL